MTNLARVVRVFNALWCLVVIGYVAYGWYAYAGVYRVFAEWQISVFGSYRVLLTALLPVLALILPLLPAAIWLQRKTGSGWSVPPDARRTAWALSAIGGVALLAAAGAGALGYRTATKEPVVAPFDLRQATALPAADRFVVTGLARTDLMLGFETESRGTKRSYSFVPLTPPDWRRGQPLTYFLKTNQTAYVPTGGGGSFRLATGQPPFLMTTRPTVVESHTLPGPLRETYANNKVKLAGKLYIFDQNVAAALEHYWMIAGIAGLGGIACLLSAVVFARRARGGAA
jgi:hypothetical protein